MNANTKTALGELWAALNQQFTPRPKTALATITDYTTDAEGRILSYQADVQEPGGVTAHTLLAVGAQQYGRGHTVTVYREGGDAIGGWRLADGVSAYGTQIPATTGGLPSVEPTLITGLGFHIPRGDGCVIVGGTLVRDPNPRVTGTRVRICANGIKGLTDWGEGDRIAFMLATEDHQTFENNQPYDIGAGDAQLGYRAQGHIYVDSSAGTFSWNVGDTTIIQSRMVDDLPYTQIAGLLRLSDEYVGAGIELGKDYRDAYVLQLLNKYNSPLIVMRAGFEDDPDRAYMRIGPPPPAPGITATSVNGVPVLIVDGEIIRNSSLTANKLNVLAISDINGNMGILQAGRIELLQPGTVFHHWLDFGNATGIVAGFDDQTQTGRLLGLNAGVIQTEVNSIGQLVWGAGNGWADADGIGFEIGSNSENGLTWYDGSTPFLRVYGEENSAFDTTVGLFLVSQHATRGPSIHLYSNSSDSVPNEIIVFAKDGGSKHSAFYATEDTTYGSGIVGFNSLPIRFGVRAAETGAPDDIILSYGGGIAAQLRSALTDAAGTHLTLRHNTSGTPAANFAYRTLYQLESSTTEDQDAAAFDVAWSTATHASRTAYMRWLLVNNAGALAEVMQLTPVGLRLNVTESFSNQGIFHARGLAAHNGVVARFTNSNFVSSSTGSSLVVGQGATTGDTYSYLQATRAGATVVTDLALNPSGGNIGLGTTAVSGMQVAIPAGSTAALNLAGTSGTITSGIRFATDLDVYRISAALLGINGDVRLVNSSPHNFTWVGGTMNFRTSSNSTLAAVVFGPDQNNANACRVDITDASGTAQVRLSGAGDSFIGLSSTRRVTFLTHSTAVNPFMLLEGTRALGNGTTADGYQAAIQMTPTYTHASGATLTRHNYFQIDNPVLTNVTLTDAALFRFPAAAGTHKVIDSGTTKSSPGTVDAWVKVNINGTIYYMPAYTSKTS